MALRKVIEVGTAAGDRQHTRVRSFRNVVLVTTALLLLVVVAVVALAWSSPRSLPLCFTPDDLPRACPAGGQVPAARDAAVVALLGALGGVLAAAVHIRDLRGTSTPYDVPVALSLLKVPAGALTALAALVAVRGDFVPGLSDLDSQEQILAYALVFGYAQQLFTRLVDRQAGSVLDSVVSKDSSVERPALGEWPPPPPPAPPPPPPPDWPDGPDARPTSRRRGEHGLPAQPDRASAPDDRQAPAEDRAEGSVAVSASDAEPVSSATAGPEADVDARSQ